MHKIADTGKTYSNVQAVLPPNPAAGSMRPEGYVRQAPPPPPRQPAAAPMAMPPAPAMPPPAAAPVPVTATPF